MTAGQKHRRGELALRVLHSLPAQHEMYFFQEMRRRCLDHVVLMGAPLAERSSAAGELLSEVMAKLLGVGSSNGAEEDPQQGNQMSQMFSREQSSAPSFQTNSSAPDQDERVRWLIQDPLFRKMR